MIGIPHTLAGDSTLNATISAVRNLDATIANVASLIFEAKVIR